MVKKTKKTDITYEHDLAQDLVLPEAHDFDVESEYRGVVDRNGMTEIKGDMRGYTVCKNKGEETTIWHSTALKVLARVPSGANIKLKFTGTKALKTGGRKIKIFSVESDTALIK
jgi:hypothetical protein